MQVGVLVPQGWKHEYDGWDPARAWDRTVELARQAEALGFESEWVFDHFHTTPDTTDEITFESFTTLAAIASVTSRVRLGHMVICAGYRNPALVAKLVSTLDVASGGRFEVGIGGGWKEDEWLAYGYGFPETRDRLSALRDALEVITRMLAPGRATYEGRFASVHAAVNVPKGIQQPRPPIIVGGKRPRRHVAVGGTFCGRAQRRVPVARTDRRVAPADPRPVRGDRPRPGDASPLGLCVRRGDARAGPGPGRPDRPVRTGRVGEAGGVPRPVVAHRGDAPPLCRGLPRGGDRARARVSRQRRA